MISFVAYKLRVYMEKNKNNPELPSSVTTRSFALVPLKIPLAMQKRERICKSFFVMRIRVESPSMYTY
jgi:hypothetical protein